MKSRTKEQREYYKLFLILLKYIPPISVVLLTIHAIICMLGYDEPVLDHIAGSSPLRAAIILVGSKAFEFCWLHRRCVWFNLIVKSLITFHLEIGLGILRLPCIVITAIVGLHIIYLLITNWKGFLKCNGNVKASYRWAVEANS